jgi:hypothetical protein
MMHTLHDQERPLPTAYRLVALWPVVLLLCFACSGCSSEPAFEFDKLDMVPVEEGLSEFSLGRYTIPIPSVGHEKNRRPIARNRLEFVFQLFALVSPRDKPKIEDAWNRHEGSIRDQVIRVCRSTSIDDLLEPELTTLKARLIGALKTQLGDHDVRQLLITEVVSQEI